MKVRLTKILIILLTIFFDIVKTQDDTEAANDEKKESKTCDSKSVVSIRGWVRDANFTWTFPICTGILIKPIWVLTVAHVLKYYDPERFVIAAGEDVAKDVEEYEGKTYYVNYIGAHPNFNPKTNRHDLALLHLEDPITDIPIAILPKKEEHKITSICATGNKMTWDDTKNFDLKCEAITIIKMKDCYEKYRNSKHYKIEGKEHICIEDESKRLWQGNKGAPLICNGVHYALISFKSRDSPLVFTRIDRQLDFIKEELEDVRSCSESIFCLNCLWLLVPIVIYCFCFDLSTYKK